MKTNRCPHALKGRLSIFAPLLLCLLLGCNGGKNNDQEPDASTAGTNGGSCAALGCDTAHRACDASDEQPVCGDCVEGYREVGDTCQLAGADCASLDCGSHNRTCSEDVDGATCRGCVTGFHQEASECVADRAATCASGFVAERCELDNRHCEEIDGGGASCGGCLDGYVERDGACVSACVTCQDQSRMCQDNGSCGGCLSGTVEEGGTCRPVKGCDQVSCGEGEVCLAYMDRDAECLGNPCQEKPNTAFVQRTGACTPCNFAHIAEGCTADHYPVAAGNESCVCVPQDGYYWDTSAGLNQPVRCDLDADGWVNTNAVIMRYSGDPVLKMASDHCELSEIDTVRLINDHGQTHDISITDPRVAGTSLRDSQGAVRHTIVLQETARNDNPQLLKQAYDRGELRLYEGEEPQTNPNFYEQKASQLNSLRKFCNDSRSDFDADGHPDLFQSPFVGRATRDFEVMAMFAHFAETHTLELPANGGQTLVIRERSRLQGAELPQGFAELPLRGQHENCTNGVDDDGDGVADCSDDDCAQTAACAGAEDCANGVDDDGNLYTDCDDPACRGTHLCDHWQQCYRFRDPLADDRQAPEKTGTDLARFGPSFGHRDDPFTPDWVGMNHSSQFKCLDVHDVLPADPNRLHPNTVATADISREFEAVVRCEMTDSANLSLTCSDVVAPTTGVYWGIRAYINGGGSGGTYLGGCVNECDLSKAEHWSKLDGQTMGGPFTACPGWSFDPAEVTRRDDCQVLVSNAGQQFCASNRCDGTIHTTRSSANAPSLWVCKNQSVLGGDAVLREQVPGGFVVEGIVAPSPRETTRLCQDSNDCTNGYSVE